MTKRRWQSAAGVCREWTPGTDESVHAQRRRIAMRSFTVTCPPYAAKDGRWTVIVRRGCIVDHLPVKEGHTDADVIKVIVAEVGCTTAAAAKALASPGTPVTFKPKAVAA